MPTDNQLLPCASGGHIQQAVFFGFLLLILPGIFFALRWSLVIPAAVLERIGLRAAMGRSAALVEGHYGRVFMIFFLYFLI